MEIEYWLCMNCRNRIFAKEWVAVEDKFACPNCGVDMEHYYRPVYTGELQYPETPKGRLYNG